MSDAEMAALIERVQEELDELFESEGGRELLRDLSMFIESNLDNCC